MGPSSKSDLEKWESTSYTTHVFSYKELEEATNNFDSSREIGDGGFGTVYYGKTQSNSAFHKSNFFLRPNQFSPFLKIITDKITRKNPVFITEPCTIIWSCNIVLILSIFQANDYKFR